MFKKSIKIALVCDWLTGMRGGEKCLHAMCQVFPQADIFTLVNYPENFSGQFQDHRVRTSFIQRLPGNAKTFRRWLPLFSGAIESFDFSDYDLVLSFSHCVAKGVKVSPGIPHICYCHTPVRYAWDMRQDYLRSVNGIKRPVASYMLNRLKRWDIQTAERVGHFIANSRHVQQRIADCYQRSAAVVYPPVDIDRFKITEKSEDYYLVLSAMVPYKRIDLAIRSFNQNGRRLIVAGSGPEYKRLKLIAKANVEFVYAPDDRAVDQLYAGCKALIFPGEEDFGIVPLEAQACGKPVIAYARGGALETIIDMDQSEDRPTGIFFEHQTIADLNKAIEHFEQKNAVFIPQNCRQNAERFNRGRYQSEMAIFIQNVMDKAGRSE